jgi:hypothetical protein
VLRTSETTLHISAALLDGTIAVVYIDFDNLSLESSLSDIMRTSGFRLSYNRPSGMSSSSRSLSFGDFNVMLARVLSFREHFLDSFVFELKALPVTYSRTLTNESDASTTSGEHLNIYLF